MHCIAYLIYTVYARILYILIYYIHISYYTIYTRILHIYTTGASTRLDFEGTQELKDIKGTPYFMAPEV